MSARSRYLRVTWALGALAPLFLGCHQSPSQAATTAPSMTPAPAMAPRTAPPDGDIAQAIRRHFQEDGLLRSGHVQVDVTQGIASLSGSVGSLFEKERAREIVEAIRGVRAVVDQVIVMPVARTDPQIKSDVESALHNDIATRGYAISVAVADGKVTLSGTSDSWQQKQMFAEVAKAVPGVKALDNTVAIHYAVTRPDAEILAEVRNRIGNDVRLDGDPLTVTVVGHTVHLSGVVGSVEQKARARSDGWVPGVAQVDDEGIVVDWLTERNPQDLKDYQLKSDAQILQAVRDTFQLDPRLKTLVPQVAGRDGTIVLTGIVADPKARHAAEADARDTVGVWNVRDEVVVQPTGKPTDADVAQAIVRLLAADVMVPDGKSIQVSSANGRITLKGTVASDFERTSALADVHLVPGVTEIDDQLVVQRPPAEIKISIEDHLAWDPMVPPNLVTVSVASDRDATLTGTVSSWSEVKAATEDALRGGAARVTNLLKLRNHPEFTARP